jgi:hypothetical protein
MEENRRLVEQSPSPPTSLDLRQQVFADALPRLLRKFLAASCRLGVGRHPDQPLLVDAVVPDLKRAHL